MRWGYKCPTNRKSYVTYWVGALGLFDLSFSVFQLHEWKWFAVTQLLFLSLSFSECGEEYFSNADDCHFHLDKWAILWRKFFVFIHTWNCECAHGIELIQMSSKIFKKLSLVFHYTPKVTEKTLIESTHQMTWLNRHWHRHYHLRSVISFEWLSHWQNSMLSK